MNNELKKMMGARILSEANDLKRTLSALAQEIQMDETELKEIVRGNCEVDDFNRLIERMGRIYPIDPSDFYIPEDDCSQGIKIMRSESSRQSSRIFDRKERNGKRTPYYEYRDTAMSKLGFFKPEWIKMLRVVNDNDPQNPDVAYNNGHFLHQMTFFIGPINFYWEVQGKKFCREMNTGDSNYITPFWPHSFTAREKGKEALILAVTFGADVRRAQKEIYTLGRKGIENFRLDYRNPNKAVIQLIEKFMANENMTRENLQELIQKRKYDLDFKDIFNEKKEKTFQDLQKIAQCLNIDPSDLMIPKYNPQEEVCVKHKTETDSYFYPDKNNRQYKIYPLARTPKIPLAKGFDIEVLSDSNDIKNGFTTSLHSYVYNYGTSALKFRWTYNAQQHEEVFNPGDSMFIQPFVSHAFANQGKETGRLCVMRVSGAMNLSAQKELSYFADVDRVIELKCWFD